MVEGIFVFLLLKWWLTELFTPIIKFNYALFRGSICQFNPNYSTTHSRFLPNNYYTNYTIIFVILFR